MSTLLLSGRDVACVVDMEQAVLAVERAFLAFGRGEAVMPAKVYLPLPIHHGDFRAMPAYLHGWAGIKWVNAHPENPKRFKLPTVMATYILNDPQSALPKAIMDATHLTALRTGAAGAVASKYLAVPQPHTIGIIGCGVQGHTLLRAHRVIYTGLQVLVADINQAAAEKFAKEVGGKAVAVEEAANADIVCTATPVHEPMVKRHWIRAETHINAMGADAPGKQELETALTCAADVFVDDTHQASESGEINVPLRQGALRLTDLRGTLGDVIAKKFDWHRGSKPTIFDSTGLAIQDLALAALIFETAQKQGRGQSFTF